MPDKIKNQSLQDELNLRKDFINSTMARKDGAIVSDNMTMRAEEESFNLTGAITKYNDYRDLDDVQFRDKYEDDTKTSYRYSIDSAYQAEKNKEYDELASGYDTYTPSVQGSIDYPSTDVRRGDVVPPNAQWMYPQLEGKQQATMTRIANEDIAFELMGLGAEKAIAKVPKLFRAADELMQGKKTLGIASQENAFSTASNYPDVTDPNIRGVLDDFTERVGTPEGQRRLKDLGRENLDPSLINLKENKDAIANFGMMQDDYSNLAPTVSLNPSIPSNMQRSITRHEIEHAMQSGNPTVIDEMLERLELKNFGDATPEMRAKGEALKRKLKISDTSAKAGMSKELLGLEKPAKRYFEGTTGSGLERSPFLSELQQYMVDSKYITHPYAVDEITPSKIKEVFKGYQSDKVSKYPLRIFNIMEHTKNNYTLISKALNKMLVAPPVAAGIGALNED